MLTNLKTILGDAIKGSYAVGAFNVQNLEFAKGILDAAEEHSSPVILQLSPRVLHFFGLKAILQPCILMAEQATVPVCVHLDHAKNLEFIHEAIESGFSSIMFDGSTLPLEENIYKTNQVSEWCRRYDISIEAEVGIVGKDEDNEKTDLPLEYTRPKEVVIFCRETSIDALAVSVGSIHGMNYSTNSLDLSLLIELQKIISVPLVMHGSSGVRDQDLQESIRWGIRKINVATKLKLAVGSSLYETSRILGIDGLANTLELSKNISLAVKKTVLSRMELFNPRLKR